MSTSGAHIDFKDDMNYSDYLDLDGLLATQRPLSEQHDEMLFIIIHQASELWMKLILHELAATVQEIKIDRLRPAFKMLARIAKIQNQLIQSWSVLSTMTPADYLTFRDTLGKASGFQSHQYRSIEFILGNKKKEMLELFAHRPDLYNSLQALLTKPGLYDETINLLASRGLTIPKNRLMRDWTKPYEYSSGVEEAWLAVYSDTEKYWDLYELAEKLVDFEDHFQQWRFRHMTTVERIIGMKQGTGGTSGVGYLQKALSIRFFPELWRVRTSL